MNGDFRMQASNPRSIRIIDEEDESVSDAMQTVFPLEAEDAYMVWNTIHVPLGYKYTLSFMVDDALSMLEQLMGNESGVFTNHWPVQELRADWHMKWQGDRLEIQAEWHSAPCSTEMLLRNRPIMIIDKGAFISEWKQVLGVILEALTHAGYSDSQLKNLAKLRKLQGAIRRPGVMYRDKQGD